MKMGKVLVAGLLAAFALSGSTAQATFFPTFDSATSSGGMFRYDANFSAGGGSTRLDPYAGPIPAPGPTGADGGFFTIYDFDFGTNSPLASITTPAGFAVSVQNVGINADGTLPNDSPASTNVTFYYTGPTITVDTQFVGFVLQSSLTNRIVRNNNFTGQSTSNVNGFPIGSIGNVTVAGVPEPASMVLLGIGGLGTLVLFRKRRRA